MKKTTTVLVATVLAAGVLSQPHEVIADVPDTIPIQGRLSEADGTPLDGDHTLHFTLYDAADTEIFSETQVVTVDNGDFTAYLGAFQSLDPSLLDGGVSMGVAIDQDVEMSPRIPFGSVPFAMHAPAIPSGMVSHFDLSACPTGWSALEEAQGRTIVGISEDDTLQGSVGAALGDMEDRTHSHTVDPAAADTSATGSHNHDTAAQANLVSSSVSVAHTHSVPSLGGTTSNEAHTHRYSRTGGGNLYAYDSLGAEYNLVPSPTQYSPGGAAGNFFAVTHTSGSQSLYTDSDSHGHTVTTNASNTGTSTSTSHNHTVTVPQQTTTSAGSHSHTVDIGGVASSSASSTMPYVQLLVCRKD